MPVSSPITSSGQPSSSLNPFFVSASPGQVSSLSPTPSPSLSSSGQPSSSWNESTSSAWAGHLSFASGIVSRSLSSVGTGATAGSGSGFGGSAAITARELGCGFAPNRYDTPAVSSKSLVAPSSVRSG